jgi:hypothetical protein
MKTEKYADLKEFSGSLDLEDLRASILAKRDAAKVAADTTAKKSADAAKIEMDNAKQQFDMQWSDVNKSKDAKESLAYLTLFVGDAQTAIDNLTDIEEKMAADIADVRAKYADELTPLQEEMAYLVKEIRARKAELDDMDLSLVAVRAIPDDVMARLPKVQKAGAGRGAKGKDAHPEYFVAGATFYHGRGDAAVMVECISDMEFRSGGHVGTLPEVTRAVATDLGLTNLAINVYAFWK